MKELIVNVDGLSNEEKWRVVEAVAKIKNIGLCDLTISVNWDSVDTIVGSSAGAIAGRNYCKDSSPTHTPQQVLEMAPKCKVRKDFNPDKGYGVNVLGCTDKEKEEVQQAFFDVGIAWMHHGAVYVYLDAMHYTNAYNPGDVGSHYLYVGAAEECNMSAQEFLDLVYEPED